MCAESPLLKRVQDRLHDRYLFDGLVDRGAFGEVYRGSDRRDRRAVAIKILTPAASTSGDAILRFRRECDILSRIRHENLVEVLHLDLIDDRINVLVMELYPRSLSGLLKECGALRVDKALWMAAQVSRALGILHTKGIVHRDVKPSNIFLTSTNVPKLGDLGVAHLNTDPSTGGAVEWTATARSIELTAAGDVLGTLSTMAPEQLAGGTVDPRCDVYGLAATLYEMLEGRTYLRHFGTFSEASESVLRQPPAAFTRVDESWRELQAVLLKGLEKNPSDRYSTIGEFAAVLSDVRPARRRRWFPWRNSGH